MEGSAELGQQLFCFLVGGMDICICTTATTDEEAKELLKALGAPFYA